MKGNRTTDGWCLLVSSSRGFARVAIWLLVLLVACAPAQQQAPAVHTAPAVAVIHQPNQGCGESDAWVFPNGNQVNFYPYAPPFNFDHLLIMYAQGGTIWGKPSYGSPDCLNSSRCQRATFIADPVWQKCTPSGHLYEVVTLDGQPVLNSILLQIIDPQTKATVYLGFFGNTWFAGPNLMSIAGQVGQAQAATQQASQTTSGGHPYLQAGAQAVGTAFGIALAAALALAVVYLATRPQSYALPQPRPYICTSRQIGSYWTTNCYP
jgi:hypothetical protein